MQTPFNQEYYLWWPLSSFAMTTTFFSVQIECFSLKNSLKYVLEIRCQNKDRREEKLML